MKPGQSQKRKNTVYYTESYESIHAGTIVEGTHSKLDNWERKGMEVLFEEY